MHIKKKNLHGLYVVTSLENVFDKFGFKYWFAYLFTYLDFPPSLLLKLGVCMINLPLTLVTISFHFSSSLSFLSSFLPSLLYPFTYLVRKREIERGGKIREGDIYSFSTLLVMFSPADEDWQLK